jgi:hypothetical protein
MSCRQIGARTKDSVIARRVSVGRPAAAFSSTAISFLVAGGRIQQLPSRHSHEMHDLFGEVIEAAQVTDIFANRLPWQTLCPVADQASHIVRPKIGTRPET